MAEPPGAGTGPAAGPGVGVPRVVALVDLSVPVGPGTAVYPGDPEPRLQVHSSIAREGFNLLSVSMGSQTGTHVDAPYHVLASGRSVDEVDLGRFAGPGVVVDATGLPPRGRITRDHLDPVRERIGPGVVVLLRTDWSAHRGRPGYFDHPFLDPDACRELLAAGVRTIGIDAISLDETHLDGPAGADPAGPPALPCHHLVAAAGGVIAENLTDLVRLERLRDPLVCLFPVRLTGADGAPVRAVALQLSVD
ncbi:cyclase family protein [Jannaschia sp. R86511]|uniref:cyclase family protein n=1 Tax=Jannaschia sp. R86511 TaxID=3093853 RepID=UPI0036D34308